VHPTRFERVAFTSGALTDWLTRVRRSWRLSAIKRATTPRWSERILTEREVVYSTDLRDPTVLLSQYDSGLELETFLNAKLRKHCEFIAHNQLLLV
jgi:hypothetical protein